MFARLMGLRTISPAELHRAIQEDGRRELVTIDVNSAGSWEQARVPGSIHLDPATYGPEALPSNTQAPLVFYCSNPLCRKAPNAAVRAKKLGYGNVRVMSAGIKGWIGAGLPTESGVAALPTSQLENGPR